MLQNFSVPSGVDEKDRAVTRISHTEVASGCNCAVLHFLSCLSVMYA